MDMLFFAFVPARILWKLNQIYHYSPTWNPKFQLPQPPGVLPRRRRHPPTAPCRRHSSSPAPSRMDDVYKWRVATWEELFEKKNMKIENSEVSKMVSKYAGFMWIPHIQRENCSDFQLLGCDNPPIFHADHLQTLLNGHHKRIADLRSPGIIRSPKTMV